MKVIMVTYDSLNTRFLPNYGCDWVKAPNFERLGRMAVTFDHCYCGSMPCMPARRELHTGRYNFLHRSWGPIEPYDDSMPEILSKGGYHTHLVSDHGHYWEDGGCTYHTRYTTWECNRGQEGDPWKPMMKTPPMPEHLGSLWPQDWANRQFMKTINDIPQTKTFNGGVEFLDLNHAEDNWFLHVETFDPHEPFYTMPEFQEIYEKEYDGPQFDWPSYAPVKDEERPYIEHVRKTYAALVTMCDRCLGRIMEKMDEYGLWEDTLLIVNTDHGFFLGEHDWWAKSGYVLNLEEVAHTPCFIYDPVSKATGRRDALIQTIDYAPTVLDFCGFPIPKDMNGKSLLPAVRENAPVHDAIIYGAFGAQITCTDGRYKYILTPKEDNWPLYNYTLMPTHMRARFHVDELQEIELSEPFGFTKGVKLMKIPDKNYFGGNMPISVKKGNPDMDKVLPHAGTPKDWKTELYDLENDPHEMHPIDDPAVIARLRRSMVEKMIENEAPVEQYTRMGLEREYAEAMEK